MDDKQSLSHTKWECSGALLRSNGYPISSSQKDIGILDFIIDPIINKTINSAKLRMYISDRGLQPWGKYRVFPITANWNEYTVTYNIGVNYALVPYTDPEISNSSYTEWDVTSIVRGWANGTIPTWGFLIQDMISAYQWGLSPVDQRT